MQNIIDQLAAALAPAIRQIEGRSGLGEKHNAGGTPISLGYSHGPGGLLTFPGVDPTIFNAAVGADSILGQLPATGSLETNPTYWTMTGVNDATGNNKNNVCDNAPTAGLMKACLTTSVFGRYELATQELELNRLGARVDRADPMDLNLVGSPLRAGFGGVFGQGPGDPSVPGTVFTNEVERKFWERAIAFYYLLARQIWVGNPANNSAGGGYKELTGLDRLINTGYRHAETGQFCPSVDSYVRNFNNVRIDANGTNTVAAITNIWYQLKDVARRTGLDPVRWVIAMKPQLFYELSAIWPCSYLTYRCQVAGNERVVVDSGDQVRFRDEMRAGKYLLIDGERVPVVLDDGIAELNGNETGSVPRGCFVTDIYFIPMSVVGGRAVTFLQYFEYQNPSIEEALGNMVLGKIEGAFLTWPRQTNQCVVWQSKIEPRLVMRTPYLAGRLQNVAYCPTQHTRDAFPNEPYFLDGGITNRVAQGPSYYAIWKS